MPLKLPLYIADQTVQVTDTVLLRIGVAFSTNPNDDLLVREKADKLAMHLATSAKEHILKLLESYDYSYNKQPDSELH